MSSSSRALAKAVPDLKGDGHLPFVVVLGLFVPPEGSNQITQVLEGRALVPPVSGLPCDPKTTFVMFSRLFEQLEFIAQYPKGSDNTAFTRPVPDLAGHGEALLKVRPGLLAPAEAMEK